jgi:hypothetical protein
MVKLLAVSERRAKVIIWSLARQLCGHEELQHRCLLNSEVLEPVGGDGW